MHWIWLILIFSGALALMIFVPPLLGGYLEAHNAPRVDMFECEKHGLFPVKYVMRIDMQDGGKPVEQCPFCYEDAFKKADSELRKREASRSGVQS